MDSQIQRTPQLGAQDLSIHRAKQLCFQRIHDCTTQRNIKIAAHAQALEQMLQLWAKHSGVDARRGMSLDDRLKDHPDLKVTLIGLLELIEQKITQALSSPDDHDDPKNGPAIVPEDDDDVDPEEFLIKQKWMGYRGNTWETVGAAVDMLIEFTAMIRKSTVRNSSLPTHFHRPDDYFAEYAKILARNWFKDTRRSLTDQLGDSVFVRRRHMLYKLKHEEKLSYPANDLPPVPAEPTVTPRPATETVPVVERLKQTNPRIELSGPTVPIVAGLAPSSTTFSLLDRARLAQRSRNMKALSGITEGSVSIEETGFSYMYPDPPTLREGQTHGVCPYCSGFLTASKLTKVAWRAHLHEDLQPYVCISEKCQDPVQFFSNSRPWLQHMEKIHGRDWPQKVHMTTWYCDREHDKMEFKGESELRKHLVNDHGTLSDAHVNALVRRNWDVGCREAHVCPLCESMPSNIIPLMNDDDKKSLLLRHIGDHLKALALFSLPSLSTDPASDEQRSSSMAQLPTDDDSEDGSAGNYQAVAPLDQDLEGSLTFDEDPHRFIDAIGFETAITKEHISDVPSDRNAKLEWKFASPEQEAPESDPVLQSLRIGHEESQRARVSVEPHERTDLLDQIFRTLTVSAFDEMPQVFVPNGSMDHLFTKNLISRELGVEASSSLVEFISVFARKIFAIALSVGPAGQLLQKRMEFFCDKNITDSSLPLQKSWWVKNYWNEASEGGGSRLDNHLRVKFEDEDLWQHRQVGDFCSVQYEFLAPVFSNTELSYDLDPGSILPFTNRQDVRSYGSLRSIKQYEIHARHIDSQAIVGSKNRDRPYWVDVKQAYGSVLETDSSWKSQVEMLSRMNSLNHKHIVRFLAAFRKGQDEGYFMSELATDGNLRWLWRTFSRPLTSRLVKAAFRQMVGLVSAIHEAHNLSPCRPGYLRPENIFWFRNFNESMFGTLKISGWGFGEEGEGTTHPRVDGFEERRGKYWNLRYEAPEFATTRSPFGAPSRLADIWSMGCVLLEFLIWLMYGVDELERFNRRVDPTLSQPTFFYQAKRQGQNGMAVVTVDPCVLEWMEHMAVDPACRAGTTALGNLLELIRNHLLVVELPQRPGLAMNTESFQLSDRPHSSIVGESRQVRERCTFKELEQQMRTISDENESERYWLAARPMSPLDVKDYKDVDGKPEEQARKRMLLRQKKRRHFLLQDSAFY